MGLRAGSDHEDTSTSWTGEQSSPSRMTRYRHEVEKLPEVVTVRPLRIEVAQLNLIRPLRLMALGGVLYCARREI